MPSPVLVSAPPPPPTTTTRHRSVQFARAIPVEKLPGALASVGEWSVPEEVGRKEGRAARLWVRMGMDMSMSGGMSGGELVWLRGLAGEEREREREKKEKEDTNRVRARERDARCLRRRLI